MGNEWLAGIDGCPGGWVAVVQPEAGGDAAGLRAMAAPDLETLFASVGEVGGEPCGEPALAGIDMPIGLSESGPRDCDGLARRRLGRRGSSVFPAPLRPALAARTHAEASARSREAGGKGVSAQAWHLFARVRELDELLSERASWRERLVEVHPELSFLALNGDRPLLSSKHRIDGIYRRRALIAEDFGMAAIESAVAQLAGTRAKEDDMLDAFAVLWSALRVRNGAAESLPADPPRDARGLPMRIVF